MQAALRRPRRREEPAHGGRRADRGARPAKGPGDALPALREEGAGPRRPVGAAALAGARPGPRHGLCRVPDAARGVPRARRGHGLCLVK